MLETKKPKRKLSNIDFSKEGAHIALCHKEQGVANMQDFALLLKAQNFSDNFIEKIQTVRVTMGLPEFLKRFFDMYNEDSEVLARMMGYKPETEEYEVTDNYEDYIQSRLESYEILKTAAETDNTASVLADLSEKQYLSVLQDQETIEKVFSKYDEEKSKTNKSKHRVKTTRSFSESNSVVAKSESSDVAVAAEVETLNPRGGKGVDTPVVKQKLKEKLMTQEVKVVEQVIDVEMVEKSTFDQIQKQAQEQADLLKSALAELVVFKAEKAALIAKSRKQSLVDAAKDADKAEALFKAVGGLTDEQFDTVVSVVKSLAEQVQQSDLFVEKGANVETQEEVKESAVAKLLKAKLQAGK